MKAIVTVQTHRHFCIQTYIHRCFTRTHVSAVSMWKLRPEKLQDEYGKLSPRVTKHEAINSYIGRDLPSAAPLASRVARDASLGVALEELAQMCGAFLQATTSHHPGATSPAAGGVRVRIDIHVGDALDFCDALFAVPLKAGGDARGVATPPPVSFQKGSLELLELKNDIFGAGRPAFDVIKSSNLADHLGG